MIKLGSLFDGAGGFPFAARLCGIEPVWASEIEAFPIAVTTKRFPTMKHLGDITKINGAEIEPVDVITFGSPCQDLSVAGRRAGLDGARSGLFMEAVRIIREMREATNGRYPRYAVWENVPGAFSSNRGEDFRVVLEELCKVEDRDAAVPRPPKGKWVDAGQIVGDGYSLGWRVLDAQYWGVPQRRRRIFLVADFGGGRAGEILFEREGLRGSFAESRESWQGITKSLAFGAGAESRATYCLQGNGIDRADTAGCNGKGWAENVSYTLNTIDRPAVVAVYDARGNGDGDHASTLTGDHENRVTDYTSIVCYVVDSHNGRAVGDASLTVRGNCGSPTGSNVVFLVYALDRAAFNQGINAQYEMGIDGTGKTYTVVAKGPGAVCYAVGVNGDIAGTLDASYFKGLGNRSGCEREFVALACVRDDDALLRLIDIILRRLTPTECARLQGMPDWWCSDLETEEPNEDDIAFWREVFETHRLITNNATKPKTDSQIVKWLKNPHSDTAEYTMWGNGLALPCALYVMEGIAAALRKKGRSTE